MSDVINRLLGSSRYFRLCSRSKGQIVALITLLLSSSISPPATLAQDSEAPAPRVVHTPPDPGRLPPPGTPLQIEATILNSSQVSQRLRVIAIEDGELFDFSEIEGIVDVHDNPHYIIPFYAPVRELSYQFFLYDKSGKVIPSQRFSLTRNCLPATELVSLPVPDDKKNDATTLANVAARLEKEIEAYENSVKLLNELEQELSKSQ